MKFCKPNRQNLRHCRSSTHTSHKQRHEVFTQDSSSSLPSGSCPHRRFRGSGHTRSTFEIALDKRQTGSENSEKREKHNTTTASTTHTSEYRILYVVATQSLRRHRSIFEPKLGALRRTLRRPPRRCGSSGSSRPPHSSFLSSSPYP